MSRTIQAEPERLYLAIHEAAHAVSAVIMGLPLAEVTITAEGGLTRAGEASEGETTIIAGVLHALVGPQRRPPTFPTFMSCSRRLTARRRL